MGRVNEKINLDVVPSRFCQEKVRMFRRNENHLARLRFKTMFAERNFSVAGEGREQTPVMQPVAPPLVGTVLYNICPAGEKIRVLAWSEKYLSHF